MTIHITKGFFVKVTPFQKAFQIPLSLDTKLLYLALGLLQSAFSSGHPSPSAQYPVFKLQTITSFLCCYFFLEIPQTFLPLFMLLSYVFSHFIFSNGNNPTHFLNAA